LTDNIITILGSAREIPRGSRWQSESFEPLANNFLVHVGASIIQAEVNCRKSSGQYSLLSPLNSVRIFSIDLDSVKAGEESTYPSAISLALARFSGASRTLKLGDISKKNPDHYPFWCAMLWSSMGAYVAETATVSFNSKHEGVVNPVSEAFLDSWKRLAMFSSPAIFDEVPVDVTDADEFTRERGLFSARLPTLGSLPLEQAVRFYISSIYYYGLSLRNLSQAMGLEIPTHLADYTPVESLEGAYGEVIRNLITNAYDPVAFQAIYAGIDPTIVQKLTFLFNGEAIVNVWKMTGLSGLSDCLPGYAERKAEKEIALSAAITKMLAAAPSEEARQKDLAERKARRDRKNGVVKPVSAGASDTPAVDTAEAEAKAKEKAAAKAKKREARTKAKAAADAAAEAARLKRVEERKARRAANAVRLVSADASDPLSDQSESEPDDGEVSVVSTGLTSPVVTSLAPMHLVPGQSYAAIAVRKEEERKAAALLAKKRADEISAASVRQKLEAEAAAALERQKADEAAKRQAEEEAEVKRQAEEAAAAAAVARQKFEAEAAVTKQREEAAALLAKKKADEATATSTACASPPARKPLSASSPAFVPKPKLRE
jgi:hypothetical protein